MTIERRPNLRRGTEASGPLEVHIEELVLYGFPKIEIDQFRKEVVETLARLFVQHRLPMVWKQETEIAFQETSSFVNYQSHMHGSMGEKVAQSIYNSLEGSKT
jgi:hypothetical protein